MLTLERSERMRETEREKGKRYSRAVSRLSVLHCTLSVIEFQPHTLSHKQEKGEKRKNKEG